MVAFILFVLSFSLPFLVPVLVMAVPAVKVVWSVEQEEIFKWFKSGTGNLIVRARAGCGKTTTIIEGILRAPDAKILATAFNKITAGELKTRLAGNPKAEGKTLNGLGYAFVNWALKGSGIKLEVKSGHDWDLASGVMPSNCPNEIVSLVARCAELAKQVIPFATQPEQLMDLIEAFDLAPEGFPNYSEKHIAEGAIKVMQRSLVLFQNLMKPANVREQLSKFYPGEIDKVISFADQIFLPLALRLVRPWFNMVVVDEAQDMNASQLLLAQGACKKGGRIVIVGDDRQAIYAFRGADSGALDRLKKELNATELGLKTTYRCGKAIVALAKGLVSDFQAGPGNPEGAVVRMPREGILGVVKPGDFILSRVNAPLASLCLKLLAKGVRATVRGRDIGAGLVSLVTKLAKGAAADSVPKFLEKLASWEKKQVERWNAAGDAAKVDAAKDKAETLRALTDGIESVPALTARIKALFSDEGTKCDNKDCKDCKGCPTCDSLRKVVLSTVHKAKGLEADTVYLLTDTFNPRKDADLSEEANIRYVAITRAKSKLVWCDGK